MDAAPPRNRERAKTARNLPPVTYADRLGNVSHITLELPPLVEQQAFNRRRWAELSLDSRLAALEERIETDRHGHIIMSPLPAASHARWQAKIAILLNQLLPGGIVLTECPISTADGVRGADVAWISRERFAPMDGDLCLDHAPEICVEVLSPSNTRREIDEKRALYHEAGALEFWTCAANGTMRFTNASDGAALKKSTICPEFPGRVELP
jgi:Uma2 family endonuclease